MGINFVKPKTKDKILFILIESPKINAKQIFSRLKRESSWNNSYQSVHKILKEMLKDGIIVKSDKNYNAKIKPDYNQKSERGVEGENKRYTRLSFVCYVREKIIDCDK